MTIFPKWYRYNRAEPTYFPYERVTPSTTHEAAEGAKDPSAGESTRLVDETSTWDFRRFNLSFWRRLDTRIAELAQAADLPREPYSHIEYKIMLSQVGVVADLILFHPYDGGHWGFDCMGGAGAEEYDTANDEFYLQYVVARRAH